MAETKIVNTFTQQLPLWMLLLGLTAQGALAGQTPFAPQVTMGERQLQLLGSGMLRFGLLIDVYSAALYGESDVDIGKLLASGKPKRLELHYYRAIAREQITVAAEQVLRKQHGEAAFEELRPALRDWHASLRGVQPGDRYVMEYDGVQMRLSLNGLVLARSNDPRLAAAYFGIWLGEQPISPRLRTQLLSARTS